MDKENLEILTATIHKTLKNEYHKKIEKLELENAEMYNKLENVDMGQKPKKTNWTLIISIIIYILILGVSWGTSQDKISTNKDNIKTNTIDIKENIKQITNVKIM